MKQATRNVPRWILAFIGSLLLFATLALICIRMTLFNQNFMIKQIHQTEYVETIRKDMTQSIQDLGRGSNIPPEVLADVVSEKTVSANVDNYIRSIYQEVPFEIQGEDQVKDNIMKNVTQYAQQKNIAIDETTQNNLNNLAASATKNYSSYIEIPYLLSYGKKVMAFKSALTLILIIAGAAFLLVFVGLLLMAKMKHQKIRWSSVTFLGGGLMLAVLPALIYFSGVIDRLGIMSEGLYQFVTGYITAFDLSFVFAGLGLTVLALLLVLISERMRSKKIHNVR
ncbi:hypothetical protein [Enterococcus malodoratus]|uniref:Uncharacterized protein n=1 Tax=Enterococcus malodoratus ATCC 43197 TaxID=1158601 RepID=R2NZL2_9ENTE|nr:hypothetical protein [Enterococcus malodoratus]EOH77467.1 hypothetical protein UAI_02104 [Enterococcus malodoratus ATCC 43197]EOT64119.1 hypothetical protein I585_03316 [Enterococcus malodoratus ATCC 43197]SPX00877.1 Uncharacterised protein [Enterococcus malodoratus]STD66175.1 Uncharacterised protein [Enterococcus malodoratus]